MNNWVAVPQRFEANELFTGNIVVVIPHSDDEALGCGIALAQVRDKSRVTFVYASDGSQSPAPPTGDNPAADTLREMRVREAQAALARLGYVADQAVFLGLPDGALTEHQGELTAALIQTCRLRSAAVLLAPFRLDSHPDHLAVHRAAHTTAKELGPSLQTFEYFVYFRYRLLPAGDIRAYVRPRFLCALHSEAAARQKRDALDCYRSQRIVMFPWQTRAILQSELLDATVALPEFFFRPQAGLADSDYFTIAPWRLRLVHWAEPRLKLAKDRLLQWARRARTAAGS